MSNLRLGILPLLPHFSIKLYIEVVFFYGVHLINYSAALLLSYFLNLSSPSDYLVLHGSEIAFYFLVLWFFLVFSSFSFLSSVSSSIYLFVLCPLPLPPCPRPLPLVLLALLIAGLLSLVFFVSLLSVPVFA
jgi:hypothetical protein